MKYIKPFILLVSPIKKEVGWSWPVFLLGCLLKTTAVFRKTHWSARPAKDAEAVHVRRLALFSAIYLQLLISFNQQTALEKYQRITMAFGLAIQKQVYDSIQISHLSGIERFMAYRKRMDLSDADRFNQKEYLAVDKCICHYIIKKCIAYDLFSEAGTPELTQFFCTGDGLFFKEAFPDLEFTRGDSWENTIAFGKDHCEYILEVKGSG